MFALLKLILNLFSGAPKLPLIPKVSRSSNTKKLILRLSARYDELLSTPKNIAFLERSLPKLHSPLKAIP